ncbi:MAG TPA: Lrp/AsnC family transcriptional regulator [Candidatus Nanoarchaeia archaeon]|nr:Lrp/AsnC family transcriptional regulator [Candidatus Nanoarchaeia archaeon]
MVPYMHLDAKDYAILRELDCNFRQSFSSIGKKIRLSKNSVALRFDKLQQYFLHNVTGINYGILNYTLVKVYYDLNVFDSTTQQKIIREFSKHPSMIYVAHLYGTYDLVIALLVSNFDDLVTSLTSFNAQFTELTNHHEIQIIYEENYFRHNFLYLKPFHTKYTVARSLKKIALNNSEKQILKLIRRNPRIPLTELAQHAQLSIKTVRNKLSSLEKNKVITGYFLTLNLKAFGYSTFKLMIRVHSLVDSKAFETFLLQHPHVRYMAKMLGYWNYEIDFIYETINDLQEQIEIIKERFPNIIKNLDIISFGERIATNNERFL